MARAYSMDQRSRSMARTRKRILDAATEVFSERGGRATTMKSVAQRAEVSPATVAHHFASPAAMLDAVIDRLLVEVRIPSIAMLEGVETRNLRIGALVAIMFEFFERMEPWYRVVADELTEVPAVVRADAEYAEAMQTLFAQVLETDDPTVLRGAFGFIHWSTLSAFRMVGFEREEAARLVGDAVIQLSTP